MVAGLPLKIAATIGNTRHTFLIDTGSSISILPYNSYQQHTLRPTGISLTNASGNDIKSYGEFDAIINLPTVRRSFQWSFVVADVTEPILGIDFLAHHSILVDCKNATLIDNLTKNCIPLISDNKPMSTYFLKIDNIDPRVREILSQFPVLTSPLQLTNNVSPLSSIQHKIDTGNHSPVYAKTRTLNRSKTRCC